MYLSTHLNFDGSCEEAMNFYAKTFDGKVEFKMTWGESPMAEQVGAEGKDKIMHMSLKVGITTVMGADAPPGKGGQKAQGMMMSVTESDLAKAGEVFKTLTEGGSVEMPFMETFWAKGFGMGTDRFGIPWMVNCEKAMPA